MRVFKLINHPHYKKLEVISIKLFLLGTSGLLAYRMFSFILRYTENLLFWDQWDIIDPITQPHSLWFLFRFQHNEHRIGVGLILTKLLAFITRWNNVAETILIGLILVVSAAIALYLKRKLTQKLSLLDVFIPYIFFTLYQVRNLQWGFQIPFVLPVLYLLLICLIFNRKFDLNTQIILIILALLSTYSLFSGLFIAGFIMLYFLYQAIISRGNQRIWLFICAITSGLIGASYFLNYQPGKGIFIRPTSAVLIFKYMVYQVNGFVGIRQESNWLYLIPTISLLCLIIILVKFFKTRNINQYFPQLILFGYSLLFSVSSAFGRWIFGVNQSQTSRYMTHMIPLYLGIYLTLQSLRNHYLRLLTLLVFIGLVIFLAEKGQAPNFAEAQYHSSQLKIWKQCYLIHQDVDFCYRQVTWYPFWSERTEFLKLQLPILKARSWNLFDR